jgi:hypothetical protein
MRSDIAQPRPSAEPRLERDRARDCSGCRESRARVLCDGSDPRRAPTARVCSSTTVEAAEIGRSRKPHSADQALRRRHSKKSQTSADTCCPESPGTCGLARLDPSPAKQCVVARLRSRGLRRSRHVTAPAEASGLACTRAFGLIELPRAFWRSRSAFPQRASRAARGCVIRGASRSGTCTAPLRCVVASTLQQSMSACSGV